jgi:hypothetical protein
MKEEMDSTEAGCLIAMAPFVIGSLIVGPVVRGWVLSRLWGWFIVTSFAAPPLHVVPSIGLMIVATFVINHPMVRSNKKESAGEMMISFIVVAFLPPLLTLWVGWLVHLFL